MTYREAMRIGTQVLTEAEVADAAIDSWYLLEYICRITRSYYYLHENDDLTEEQQNDFESAIKKRAERIPFQYITGIQEFMGLKFHVNSSVLIPRQDTETLVEEALKVLTPEMKVLDVCTGSGCIIISLADKVPGITASASDISKQALLVAKDNGKLHETAVEWIRSDLFENIDGTFDMIVSNPPYIRTADITELMPEVRDFEPYDALDGTEDGLFFYRKIVSESSEYLNEGGFLYLEIGYDQAEDVSQMMREAGFEQIEVVKDLAGLDRVVKGRK